MLSSIKDYFSERINGRQFLALFEQMARTITNEYIQDIYTQIEVTGCPPSFENNMSKVTALTNELMLKAEWMRDNYKEGKGYRSIRLTTGCKRVIKASVAEYLKQVKSVNSIRRMQHAEPMYSSLY